MTSPFYQDVHQASPPPSMTPADSPSSPPNFAGVTPHGRGPAPYDLQAPSPEGEVSSAFAASIAENGAGVLYPVSPRIAAARELLESPQGYGVDGFDVMAGFHGGGGGSWPVDVEPGG